MRLDLCALLIADDDNDDTDDTDLFLSSFWKEGVIIYVIIYIMINRIINNSCLEIINTPLSSLSSLAKKGLGEEGRRRDSNCAFDFAAR